MKPLMSYTAGLKRRLRTVLGSKKIVAVMAVGAMCVTLLLVRAIKAYPSPSDDSNSAVLLEEAMRGKKAVSMIFDISELPVEMLYPGIIVDIVDRSNAPAVENLVKGVTVVGLSYLAEREQAKVFVAVNEDEGLRILGAGDKKLGLVIVGQGQSNEDDIEIIEF